jgi:hypothetical protein
MYWYRQCILEGIHRRFLRCWLGGSRPHRPVETLGKPSCLQTAIRTSSLAFRANALGFVCSITPVGDRLAEWIQRVGAAVASPPCPPSGSGYMAPDDLDSRGVLFPPLVSRYQRKQKTPTAGPIEVFVQWKLRLICDKRPVRLPKT